MNADFRNQGHKGILVGGLQSCDLPQGTRQNIADCCASAMCEFDEQGNCCRSFWLPDHGYSVLLYREKENVIVIVPGDGEIVALVHTIFTVPVLSQRRAFIKAKKFEWDGHSIISDHRNVKETNHYLFVELENVSRKVMLQALTTDPGGFFVIDFMRRLFPITVGNVVLP